MKVQQERSSRRRNLMNVRYSKRINRLHRIKQIEKSKILRRLTRTLDKIEREIVSLIDRDLPKQMESLSNLQSAVAIRPKIKAILDKEYLPFADRVVRKGFGEQAKRIEKAFKTNR